MWCSCATIIARYGSSCAPRTWNSASTPSHGCAAIIPPLVVGEAARLVQHVDAARATCRCRGTAPPCPRSYSCSLLKPEALAQRDGEDADVHAVGERVFVVVANRRQADERRLLVQDLVDDALHHALDLLDVRAARPCAPSSSGPSCRHRLRVRPLGALLRFLAVVRRHRSVGGAERERRDAGARPASDAAASKRSVGSADAGACRSDRKTSQSFAVDVRRDA